MKLLTYNWGAGVMRSIIGCLIGLILVGEASAESLVEGRVRLASGQPVGGAQVRLFAATDLGPLDSHYHR